MSSLDRSSGYARNDSQAESTLSAVWQTARFALPLDRVLVMGIVNVTPDSFSDGGQWLETSAAMRHCELLLKQGADILDIGGESTRPGARAVSADEELRRVLPVVRGAASLRVPLSVDTSKPEVMRAVLDAGADIVNDVRGLRDPRALAIVARHPTAGVCLMHMPGEPSTMQSMAVYDNVTREVSLALSDMASRLRSAGVAADRIVLDPGYGFGKTLDHNIQLLHEQRELLSLGYPLLVGLSRKSMLGVLTGGRPAPERVAASVAAALAASDAGARIVRVHDVQATTDALAVWRALRPNGSAL